MRPELLPGIDALRAEVEALEAKVAETKALTNRMCELAGVDQAYPRPQSNLIAHQNVLVGNTRYAGMSLGEAARRFMEERQKAGQHSAHPREIYLALKAAGVRFDTRTEENAIQSVRSALIRLPAIFTRLEGGDYSLAPPPIAPSAPLDASHGGVVSEGRQRVKSRGKRSPRRAAKAAAAAAKVEHLAVNRVIGDFIANLLKGNEQDTHAIKQAALHSGIAGVDATTPLTKFQGILLNLRRQNRAISLGDGRWTAPRADAQAVVGGNVHTFKGVA